VTPTSATVGRLLFDAVRILPAAVAVLVASVIFGDRVHHGPLTAVGLLAIAAGWSMAYNAAFHVVVQLTKSAQAPQAMLPLFAPLTFLSTVWFPRQLMPAWADHVARLNPVSGVVEAARQLSAGGHRAGAVLMGSAVIAGVAVVGISAAVQAAHWKGVHQ